MKTNGSHVQRLLVLTMALIAVSAGAGEYGNYSGKGGMQAYKITKEAYAYHYDKGFTGADAMGWDPNLQFVWSRLGAAKTCDIGFDSEKVVGQLISKFGHDKLTHNMIGIDFHHMQSKSNPDFCMPERVTELRTVVPEFEKGLFPKKF